jgi:diguanylate cyclase (GGDEF)-like protein
MRYERLRYIQVELTRDSVVTGLSSARDLYYQFNGAWYDGDQTIITDDSLKRQLQRTLRLGSHWRPTKSKTAFFPLTHAGAVVVAALTSASTKSKRDYFQLAVDNCAKHGENAYRAAHDVLTDLPNRERFETSLKSFLAQTRPPTNADPEALNVLSRRQIAVCSLDIDYFKRINDTYGHQYGDLVLKSFARRENHVKELAETHSGRINFLCARLGGEEFAILMEGSFTVDQVKEFVEQVRQLICGETMPSADDWPRYRSEGLLPFDTLPPESERIVSCSIGAAIAAPSATASSLILKHADAALYKAKLNGRNRCCFYPDILRQYGRTLEHDKETGIVAIDVGGNVGVQKGQEFRVYFPKFTGEEPLLVDDGRSRRKLGVYPRVACERFEVFIVQPDISFCRVVTTSPRGHGIPNGSALELVPIGSITPLPGEVVMSGSDVDPSHSTPTKLSRQISAIKQSGQSACIVVIRIFEIDEAALRLGTAFINNVLQATMDGISAHLPFGIQWAFVGPTEIGVVTRSDQGNELSQSVGVLLEQLNAKFAGRLRLCAGIVDTQEFPANVNAAVIDDQAYAKLAVQLAQYAASDAAQLGADGIPRFSAELAVRVVSALRVRGRSDVALQDYQIFRAAGVVSAELEHWGAYAALDLAMLETAEVAIDRAAELAPEDGDILGSAAFIRFVADRFCDAAILYERALATDRWRPDSFEKPIYAMAIYRCWETTDRTGDRAKIIAALNEALADVKENSYVSAPQLRTALARLRNA